MSPSLLLCQGGVERGHFWDMMTARVSCLRTLVTQSLQGYNLDLLTYQQKEQQQLQGGT